jgi:hypothetical protein
VSETGHRCPARTHLEFDHVHEVARGGEASVAGIRLRCRAHNQYQAECTFGTEFMRQQRRAAQATRTAGRARAAEARAVVPARVHAVAKAATHAGADATVAAAAAQAGAREPAGAAQQARAPEQVATPVQARARDQAATAEWTQERDVVPWLRALGFNAAEARRAAALCEAIPDASLEERVRRALTCFHVRGTRVVQPTECRAAHS